MFCALHSLLRHERDGNIAEAPPMTKEGLAFQENSSPLVLLGVGGPARQTRPLTESAPFPYPFAHGIIMWEACQHLHHLLHAKAPQLVKITLARGGSVSVGGTALLLKQLHSNPTRPELRLLSPHGFPYKKQWSLAPQARPSKLVNRFEIAQSHRFEIHSARCHYESSSLEKTNRKIIAGACTTARPFQMGPPRQNVPSL